MAISKFAWEFDMFDEKACTGKDSPPGQLRKIVFVGPDQSNAYGLSPDLILSIVGIDSKALVLPCAPASTLARLG